MQASRRITPNTKCVTPARWGNRGAAHGADSNTEFFTDAPSCSSVGCTGKTTEGRKMACKICDSGNTASLGMRTPHIYCRSCGAHEYEGQVIDKNAWNSWINGDTERPIGDSHAPYNLDRRSAQPCAARTAI